MQLERIIANLNGARIVGDPALDVAGVADDSRRVTPGGLFAAVRGTSANGHDFVAQAIDAGATAVMVEDASDVPAGFPHVVVEDSREAVARAAHAFFGDPTRHLPLVGVTGTNGKTTTLHLIESILVAAGMNPGGIGTVSYRTGARSSAAGNTTPGPIDLAGLFNEMLDAGCRSAVFEVSSHALDQKRAIGCQLDVACFTNLTRDHLDYHTDEESYFAAKRRLFTDVLAGSAKDRRAAVINVDDPFGRRLAAELAGIDGIAIFTVNSAGVADATVRVKSATCSLNGTEITLDTPSGPIACSSPLIGRFNQDNIAMAAAAALALGVDARAIREGVGSLAVVPGRLERVIADDITVLVDYAHTGDALERSVSTVRELARGRVITVFGCGGDRDRGKRPIMGAAAAKGSDLAVVTSDNPRTEDPLAIIDEILFGVRDVDAVRVEPDAAKTYAGDRGYVVEPDRAKAIALAVAAAAPGDVVLIAGKGHEDYQILGTKKVHFDDREQAAAAIAKRKAP